MESSFQQKVRSGGSASATVRGCAEFLNHSAAQASSHEQYWAPDVWR